MKDFACSDEKDVEVDTDIATNNGNNDDDASHNQNKDASETGSKPRKPINEFLTNFDFESDRSVVRFYGNRWSWNVSYAQINSDFKRRTKELSEAVIAKILEYFKNDKCDLMQNIAYLFDSKNYAMHNSLNEASKHGEHILQSVLNYFKIKKIPIGESFRVK